ncbi:MAG: heavy metal translocating P-type ATPase [Okeania sp. SIO2C9]|uniref:heavy metal translocating P-type ATPase n=1 Tax=Okeania sp. SIO2C9 TaxID=2607791 RepID=UPI0013C25501|nr:heavy metal translocating P-type ATPase [Okeania sp. SIO2C9]NEQ74259.1 heavy metal translocating P-type ATPase [Okeania sp. SIO2C9]
MNQKNFSLSQYLQLAKYYPEAFAAGTCALLIFLSWFCLEINWVGLALLILATAYLIGGYESAKEGITTLWSEKELDVDLLMIVAALGAAALGLWQQEYHLIIDGAVLILIFAISGALETFAMERTERNIQKLMAITPDTARLIVDNQETEIPVNQLKMGDFILVKPGELIPTDSIIIEGSSTINQAPITGESIPVDKTVGDEVFAGTLNGNGVLRLQVNKSPESSLIQRVIRLVEQAKTETPPSQRFVEKFEKIYAKVIVISGLLLGILPPFLLNWSWETTIYRALIFLVVASPCALMAAIMPTLLSGIANGARQGILFKNGAQLEMMGEIKAIAFDKTGTLTTGKLQVVDIIPRKGKSENEVLQLAAALESCSEHPIGKAITQTAITKNIQWQVATNVTAKTGEGITGIVNSEIITVGKENLIKSEVNNFSSYFLEESNRLQKQGKTVIFVAQSQEIIGLISVADTVRLEASQMINKLKSMNIKSIAMLTGDNQQTADSVAQNLGINQVYYELLPEDKLMVIKQLQQQNRNVAMVGDGINDAPALSLATVGIAMGNAGSDVALESADIVLMADRLEKLVEAINLGRRANRIIKQNITFAIGFIFLLLVANFTGNINMPFGVLGHEGSTVLVTLSGLRLLK